MGFDYVHTPADADTRYSYLLPLQTQSHLHRKVSFHRSEEEFVQWQDHNSHMPLSRKCFYRCEIVWIEEHVMIMLDNNVLSIDKFINDLYNHTTIIISQNTLHTSSSQRKNTRRSLKDGIMNKAIIY